MPLFKRSAKKLPRHLQQVVLDAVEDIAANPEIGESKKGDLGNFKVHKFLLNRQLTLLAYIYEPDNITLYMLGPHENFYKRLKKYIKKIGK